MIRFTIPCVPVPQARARTVRVGAGVRTYDPPHSAEFKRTFSLLAAKYLPRSPLDGALKVTLTFDMPRPKSLPKRVTHHTRKPDATNLAKGVEDSLSGLLWRDDSQIAELVVRKVYAQGVPGVTVEVEPAC